MKYCPNCNDMALYDDSETLCPICDSHLAIYQSQSRQQQGNTRTSARRVVRPMESDTASSEGNTYQFERHTGRAYLFHGTVAEVNAQARLHNRFKKLVNSLFYGEPYQFGNTSHETIIRLEELHYGRLATQRRDLIAYGDINSIISIGDELTVRAVRHGDRYVVTSIYSDETESSVPISPQLPSAVIILLFLLALAFIWGIISFFANGGLIRIVDAILAVILALVTHLLPSILGIAILIFIIRLLIRGR